MDKLDFAEQLRSRAEVFDRALSAESRFFKRDIVRFNPVMDAAWYSLSAAGKRLRAVLCLEWCKLLGGAYENALPFAAAIEMVHAYSLIHDDLPCMDNDDLRRGKPACHKMYGEATALLAGDALLTLAFETIAAAEVSAEARVAAMRLLAEGAGGCHGMIYGQMRDMQYENRAVTKDELARMNAAKTGELIIAACQLGCVAATGLSESIAVAYAEPLGLLFQLTDDILDETATTETLGKPVGSDTKNSKSTWVSLLGMAGAQVCAHNLAQQAATALDCYGEEAQFLRDLALWTECRSH
jgi:geranylgeranyl diphosphate synthase type II